MSEKVRVQNALDALKRGEFVCVYDDHERENEADLIIAAEKVTPEKIAFMVKHSSGILCVPMLEKRLAELELPQMVAYNTESHRTAFTISIDYKDGTTTGISAKDRTKTILALINSNAKPADFARPGHIFPLKYAEGGVLKRAGHTEAGVDLAKMAGLYPACVISEIINEDGSVAASRQAIEFADSHNICHLSVADIVRYRRQNEKLIERISSARIPTKYGEFTAYIYKSVVDGIEHIALVKGDVKGKKNTPVRVHSECLTGDVFGSCRCDCGPQLHLAMKKLEEFGYGVLVYLRGHEGRGIGLGHKMRAYNLQDKGYDTVEANLLLGFPADTREYGIGAQILADLGVTTIRLMTNNPAKYGGLQGFDLDIVERIPLVIEPNEENVKYLLTKREKLGHLLPEEQD
jgi:3,4-dihydroxy 2-butanone 4-phosphate synthase / GTP cyclohydrolase II